MKRFLTIACTLMLAAVFADERNLVNNADFKQLSASGGPGGWIVRPSVRNVRSCKQGIVSSSQ